jgi:hypothetical protein
MKRFQTLLPISTCAPTAWDSPELLEHMAAFAKLHVLLAPYRAELMKEMAATGMPLTRPMMMHYAADPVVGPARYCLPFSLRPGRYCSPRRRHAF